VLLLLQLLLPSFSSAVRRAGVQTRLLLQLHAPGCAVCAAASSDSRRNASCGAAADAACICHA
jgi:hypothetical protein